MAYNKKRRRKYYLHEKLKDLVIIKSRDKLIIVNYLLQSEVRENKYFCELMESEYGYAAQTSI